MSDDLAYIGSLYGPEYAWLGHFRDPAILCAGHNTDDAERQDEVYETYNEGAAPNKISDKPGGA